ncbi:formylmethanofuran dehydrogenase, subunit F [Archaeoglobus sulfaticallidus PM70-1]|uniref:Formylmethanofuran dehydrogenase, subunit F n=1 Tax=Archaeoglobus sulfaticallidus PM70-1 TaxID=387631 RepID=N0BA36_9EURY|nr:4Fe-4S binding protein [Archaeoglobus sulfaticallidus]AGK60449.1 formylmethanofuran dehydrogenase, subunit F [Archaeoglobus sulfaticallidus PM70-1]
MVQTELLNRKSNSELYFSGELCRGCQICTSVCPRNAISVFRDDGGFTAEVGDNCNLCGTCSDFCPYGALAVKRDGKKGIFTEILKKELEFEKVSVDDSKCTYCGLCMQNCPHDAISVKRKLNIGKIRGGKIEIRDGCINCRLCVMFCPTKAISVSDRPEINEDRCIYCEICSAVCPKDVISVHCDSCRLQASNVLEGRVEVDESRCATCGICAEVCPENAIRVNRLFKGRQHFKAEKCYGLDCSICKEICPNLAIQYRYTPEKEVIFLDRCNFCGVCENSCPAGAIEIERELSDDVNLLEIHLNGKKVNKKSVIAVNDNCFGCGICSSLCPLIKGGLTIDLAHGKAVVVDSSACTACGVCSSNCPAGAITIREVKT